MTAFCGFEQLDLRRLGWDFVGHVDAELGAEALDARPQVERHRAALGRERVAAPFDHFEEERVGVAVGFRPERLHPRPRQRLGGELPGELPQARCRRSRQRLRRGRQGAGQFALHIDVVVERFDQIGGERRQLRMEFAYDGGGLGKGGGVALCVDGAKIGEGRVEGTMPLSGFSSTSTTPPRIPTT